MSASGQIFKSQEILKRIGSQTIQSVQDADTLIDGLTRNLEWLAVDRLNSTEFMVKSEIETRLGNVDNAMSLVAATLEEEIKRLNMNWEDSALGGMTHLVDHVQATSDFAHETLDTLNQSVSGEITRILGDLAEYYSPDILTRIASQIALIDKIKEIFSPTPEQVLQFQKEFQEAKLKDFEVDWENIKSEDTTGDD